MEKEMHKDAVRMDGGAGMKSQRPEREERLRIGITPGEGLDFDYEVLARLFADTSAFETALPFVYGSARKLVDAARRVGLNEASPIVQRSILDVKGKRLQMVEPERSGDTSQRDIYAILQEVVSDLKGGHLRALVSLPLVESNVRQAHPEFKNQAVAVASAFPGNPFRMLLCGNLRLSFLTTVRREDSETYLSNQRIEQRIRDLYQTLQMDFSISTPRIAVLGMNKDLQSDRITLPGTQRIMPVVNNLFENGIPVFGPFPARAFFASQDIKAFDAVLCMYKEQMEMCIENRPREDMCYFTASLPVTHLEPMLIGNDLDVSFRALFRAVCLAMDMDAARQQNRLLAENPLGYSVMRPGRRDNKEEDSSEKVPGDIQ